MYKRVLRNGKVQYTVSLGNDGTGKYPKKTKTFPAKTPKREVDAWAQALRADFGRGLIAAPNQATANQVLDEWLKTTKWQEKTRRDNEGHLKRYVRPVIGPKKIQDIRPIHAQAIFTRMVSAGLSRKTVSNVYQLVNAAFGYAVDMDYITKNPVPQVKKHIPEGVEAAPKVILSPREVGEFLGKVEKHKPLFTFLVMTGLRIGEALALEWNDVQDGKILVRQTVKDIANGFSVGKPKTPSSMRTVYLAPEVKQLLDGLGREGKYVFSEDGVNKYQSIRKAFSKAAPKGMDIHDLRHTACTLMLLAGINPKVVSGMLGHTSVAFTLDTYAHLIPDSYEGVPEKLSGILLSTGFQLP